MEEGIPSRLHTRRDRGDDRRPAAVSGHPLGTIADEIRVSYHGFIHTHLDFLNHNFIGDGVTYNGYRLDLAEVAAQGGHARNTMHNAKSGIVTRCGLIDMARFRNVPYLEPVTPIHIEGHRGLGDRPERRRRRVR